jgi:V8-like Glu-specific endopeptidase
MAITLGNRFVAMLTGVVVLCSPVMVTMAASPGRAAGLAGLAGGVPVAGRPGAMGAGEQDAAARYWTTARKSSAAPAAGLGGAWLTGNTAGHGLRWGHGGAVERVLGKVYFTLNRTDYVCSGTVVRAAHADVVLTAAHCVNDGAGHWAVNWTFVPDYRDGRQPYGAFTARRFFVDPRWAAGREQYDVAFVQVNPATLYGAPGGPGDPAGSVARSRPVTRALPAGLPVAFAARPASVRLASAYVFGYPAEPPFSGEYPNYCAGRVRVAAATATSRTRCGMTAGDSGGPWLTRFRPRSGRGVIVGVTTFKLSSDLRVLYGTVLGPWARRLYAEAEAVAVAGRLSRGR